MKHLQYLLIVVLLMSAGCADGPTAPSRVGNSTTPPPTLIAGPVPASFPGDGNYRGTVAPNLFAELTLDRTRGHQFRVITSANKICVEAGGVNQPLVFTPTPGTLGCYTRDVPAGNASQYVRVCLTSADRADGAFWMHPGTHFDAEACINGPDPPPVSARQLPATGGGSFAFTMMRLP